MAKDQGSGRMQTRNSGGKKGHRRRPASPKPKTKPPNKQKVETNSDNSSEDMTDSGSEHLNDHETSRPSLPRTAKKALKKHKRVVVNYPQASQPSDIDSPSSTNAHQSTVQSASESSSGMSEKDSPNSFTSSGETPPENAENPSENAKKLPEANDSKYYWMIVAIGAIFACSVYVVLSKPQESTAAIVKSKLQIFQEKLEVVQNQFPSQDTRLWKMIRIVLEKHHTTYDNDQPAVLMLASEKNAHRTSECLATRLAVLYSHNCTGSFVVSGAAIHERNTLDAKHEIDQQISANFEAGSCAVVVTRFELIPAGATTVFYQYCENDNAPFKDVAVLFTVQVEAGKWSSGIKDFSNLQPKRWENVVVKYLEHSLNSRDPVIMTEDLISGLMSRITPAVVWVKPEDDLHC